MPTIRPAPPKQARRWLGRARIRGADKISPPSFASDDGQADSGQARPRAFGRARRGASVAARAPGSCSLLDRRHAFDNAAQTRMHPPRPSRSVGSSPADAPSGVIPARAAPRSSRQLFASRQANHVRWLARIRRFALLNRAMSAKCNSRGAHSAKAICATTAAPTDITHIKEIAPFLRTHEKAPDDLHWRIDDAGRTVGISHLE